MNEQRTTTTPALRYHTCLGTRAPPRHRSWRVLRACCFGSKAADYGQVESLKMLRAGESNSRSNK